MEKSAGNEARFMEKSAGNEARFMEKSLGMRLGSWRRAWE